MILYGSRAFTKLLGMLGLRTCPNCQHHGAWQLIRVRRWFTLFFIPLIPYSTKYYELCPQCETGVKRKKKDVQAILDGTFAEEENSNGVAEREEIY